MRPNFGLHPISLLLTPIAGLLLLLSVGVAQSRGQFEMMRPTRFTDYDDRYEEPTNHRFNHNINYNSVQKSRRSLNQSQQTTTTTKSPSLSLNSTTSPLRQRKLHSFLPPAYEIVDPPQNDQATSNKSMVNSRQRQNLTDQEFRHNLVKLKAMVRAKQRQVFGKTYESMEQQQSPSDHRSATIDDDINAINVLINMLTLANKRLIERRDNMSSSTPRSSKASKRHHGGESNLKTLDQRAKSNSRSNSSLSRGWTNSSSEETGGLRSGASPDHILVRPGYDSHQTPDAERRKDSLHQEAQHPAFMLHPSLSIEHQRDNPMQGHKPIVAHDLLNQHQPQSHHQQPPTAFYRQPYEIRGPLPMSHPLYEYLQRDNQQGPFGMHPLARAERPAVPPYNGLAIDWSRQPPGNSLGPHSDILARPPMTTPPTRQPLDEERQAAVKQAADEADQPPPRRPPASSVHSLVEAMRGHQAAALAHERQKAEHEMELQRRQKAAKREHEEHLAKQRQLALEAAKRAAEEEAAKSKQQQVANQVNNQTTDQSNEVGNDSDNRSQEADQPQDQANEQQDNNQQTEQKNDDGQQQHQQPEENDQANDPDMKSFQNFAGDTDFTDLFPPGILSEAEIREMKRDQAEQRRRQEEEERERQQQDSNDEPINDGNNQESDPQTNENEPESGASGQSDANDGSEKQTDGNKTSVSTNQVQVTPNQNPKRDGTS